MDISRVTQCMHERPLPAGLIMNRFRVIDEAARFLPAYSDPCYLPFYFYLGRELSCHHVVCFGLGLGLPLAWYLMADRNVETVLAVQEPVTEFYTLKHAQANIRMVYTGTLVTHYLSRWQETVTTDLAARIWDLGLLDVQTSSYDEQRSRMQLLWNDLATGGILCVDHLRKHTQAFTDFAKIVNRVPILAATRYGTGLLIK